MLYKYQVKFIPVFDHSEKPKRTKTKITKLIYFQKSR